MSASGALQQTLSESDVRPESAVQREKEFRGNEGIKRASTVPDDAPSTFTNMDSAVLAHSKGDHLADANIEQHDPEVSKEKAVDDPEVNGSQRGASKDESSSNTLVSPDSAGQARPRGRFRGMFKKKEKVVEEEDPDKPPPLKFTVGGQLKATVFNSYINVLLLAGKNGSVREQSGSW